MCQIQTKESIQPVSDHKSNIDEWMGFLWRLEESIQIRQQASQEIKGTCTIDCGFFFNGFFFVFSYRLGARESRFYYLLLLVYSDHSILGHREKCTRHMGDSKGGSYPKSPLVPRFPCLSDFFRLRRTKSFPSAVGLISSR